MFRYLCNYLYIGGLLKVAGCYMIFKLPAVKCLFLSLIIFLASCRAYKQDILFQLNDDFSEEHLAVPVAEAEQNYRLQPGDLIRLDVFTNKGERIVDPNYELSQGIRQGQQARKEFEYLIQADGTVKLPIADVQRIAGFTLREAEQNLESVYNDFYKESFVKLQVLNRRVIVLGSNGGQVVRIENENTSLVEVLAAYGGLTMGDKANKIKLIRGELTQPEVYMIDLTTIAGMRNSIVEVRSGDIIYVEPWRRAGRTAFTETLRDISPLLGLATSVFTLIVVIQNLNQ